MIEFQVDDKVTFSVQGKYTAADGTIKPFDFRLIARRLGEEEIRDKQARNGDQSQTDFVTEVAQDWDGVRAAGGEPVPFTKEGLYRLLNSRAGLGRLAFIAYMAAISAKEKN